VAIFEVKTSEAGLRGNEKVIARLCGVKRGDVGFGRGGLFGLAVKIGKTWGRLGRGARNKSFGKHDG